MYKIKDPVILVIHNSHLEIFINVTETKETF